MKKGLTLLEQIKENKQVKDETGRLFGLAKLKLKEEDPLKFETFATELDRMMIYAFETARRVAASPIVQEGGDAMWHLMVPTGEVVAITPSLIAHSIMPHFFVEWMIENGYEDDPGIREGDVFELNVTAITGVHTSDSYNVMPIFHNGELVAWTATMIHSLETGGINPGSVSFACSSRFGEGIMFVAEKIAEKGKLKNEYIQKLKFALRLPEFWLMDEKTKLAGMYMIERRVHELIEKYGVEYFQGACKELIENSRRYAFERNKLLLVPGRIRVRRNRDFLFSEEEGAFPEQKRDFMTIEPIEITIESDAGLTASFAGATAALPFGANFGTKTGFGALAVAYIDMILYGYVNEGLTACLKVEAPEGSWANPFPVVPWAPTNCPWGFLFHTVGNSFLIYSRAMFSRGFVEEVLSGGEGGAIWEMWGRGLHGYDIALLNVDQVLGNGKPAMAICDGEDCSFAMPSPDSDAGNIEFTELLAQYVYLGRRFSTDQFGKGKYRSGGNFTDTLMITAPEVKLNLADGGSHCSTLPNTGLYGGYPPPPIRIHTCTPEGVKKRIGEKKELVHGRGDRENPEILKISESKVKLDIRAPKIGMISLEQYSIVDIEGGSPGGLGDPLERDPELVKRDLEKGYTTVNTARSTWGVKCDEYDKKKKKYMIDYEGTQKLRDELRARRKKRSVPFKEWWKKEREKILKKELEEPVIRMFREAVGLSSAYDLEVREFWCLPADFQF